MENECVNRVVRLEMLKISTVLRLVITNAVKRKENATRRTRRNTTKHEEKREQRGANCAKNADIKTRKLGCPFPLCVASELGTTCIDEGLFKKVGKLND